MPVIEDYDDSQYAIDEFYKCVKDMFNIDTDNMTTDQFCNKLSKILDYISWDVVGCK